MEFYGADTQRAISRCLQDVRSCDVYVGIVAFRYGSRPPGHDKSFTRTIASKRSLGRTHMMKLAGWLIVATVLLPVGSHVDGGRSVSSEYDFRVILGH